MHARGRRRAKTRINSSRDENVRVRPTFSSSNDDSVVATRTTSHSTKRVMIRVIQSAILLFLFSIVLGSKLRALNEWFPSPSITSSRNRQRIERRRQRQELKRQKRHARKEENSKANASTSSKSDLVQLEANVVNSLMNPHDSQPPKPIPMLSASPTSLLYLPKAALQLRHECIAAIRNVHQRVLGHFLRNRPKASTFISKDANVLLVDPAYHGNVGDHMISLGETTLLEGLGYKTLSALSNTPGNHHTSGAVYDECTYFQGGPFLAKCDEILQTQRRNRDDDHASSSRVALWHGGGNWGDLWPKVQVLRASSLEALFGARYNTIISMPQSLHFGDTAFQTENSKIMEQALLRKGRSANGSSNTTIPREVQLVLTWREQESFDKAVHLYPFATNLVVPDIAFQLGPYQPIVVQDAEDKPITSVQPPLDILLLLRDDHESLYLGQRNRQAIRQMLSSISSRRQTHGVRARSVDRLMYTIVDWKDRLDRFESQSTYDGKKDIFFTNTSIQLLSLGRVIVCDRLHAAILAYLVGIPFVFVDQSTGKISRTLRTSFHSVSSHDRNNSHDTSARCLDSRAALWSQADNLTTALETALDFLEQIGH